VWTQALQPFYRDRYFKQLKGHISMDRYRVSGLQWSGIPRRSFVLAISGVAAIFSFARATNAAGIPDDGTDRIARLSRGVPRSEDTRISGVVDLKSLGPDQQVAAIRRSNDVYSVTTISGRTVAFPEFNLRLKTDSSEYGPAQGRPVLLATSMDRAIIVFAASQEISSFIAQESRL
jgi:cytochrome c